MPDPMPQALSAVNYDRYKKYLLEGESIESVFDLGTQFLKLYQVIATNRRLIVVKKFPKNLLEVDYANIELIEYYTNVDWRYAIYSGFVLLISVIFFINRGAVISGMSNFLPPLAPILEAPLFPGFNTGEFILTAAALSGFLYLFGLFVLSLMGRLRILIYDQPPIDMISSLSPDIQNMIKVFETKKRTLGTQTMQQRFEAIPPLSPPKK